MIIVYSKSFGERYPTNPVESPNRVMLPARELIDYDFVEPTPAGIVDIARVHTKEHIHHVKRRGVYDAACMAAGGACTAAEIALKGEASFGLIRPPGHHAHSTHAWGMCFFNNMAIAVKRIRDRVRRVLIIDIDLHFGDGTVSIFRWDEGVRVVNIGAIDMMLSHLELDSRRYLEEVRAAAFGFNYDIVGVSAGFDTYLDDWGGLLGREDYRSIGEIIREGSEQTCDGRRFALLEGGYHPDLRYCVRSFISGFE